jgi:hypothetical protein
MRARMAALPPTANYGEFVTGRRILLLHPALVAIGAVIIIGGFARGRRAAVPPSPRAAAAAPVPGRGPPQALRHARGRAGGLVLL